MATLSTIPRANPDGILRGKRVLIFQQRGWGKLIGRFLARKLTEEGAALAALTFKKSTHELIVNQPNARYELVINHDEIMGRPREHLKGERLSLEEISVDLGVDSLWPLIYTLRNHVKSYRDKFYYGFKQNVSDEGIVEYVMAAYKCLRRFFDEFRPDVIVSPNFVSFPHIMCNLMGLKRGVPMLGVTDSKIKGYFLFSESYQDDRGAFHDRLEALKAGTARSERVEEARRYIREFRTQFKRPDYARYAALGSGRSGVRAWLKSELAPYAAVARWYLRGNDEYMESVGISVDYRPPRIILRDHYAGKRYRRRAETFPYYPFEKIERFVYLPLQFQPEATIDVMAPFAANQIETARQVAMSLPGDYTLVVKEHPGMIGLRPPSYLEKVARTVNVKLVDYRLSSEAVLRRARLIVSPSSTTLAEAAFLNVPAIQLGNLGTTLKLPNVWRHTDMTTLALKIKELLDVDLHTAEYERRLEQYVAAVLDTGFDFDYLAAWERGKGDLETLWQIYRKEIIRAVCRTP